MTIARQFVQVGARRVLVRHAGRGPAVVLVHQSPQNSRSMEPWIERLAASHAVFAPDTPGYGHADPLPLAAPTIADYAEALAELLDALGLQRVLLLGMHTGAAIAVQLALERPGRVAALVCDGLSLFDDAERRALLAGYLPPFEPTWDGGHLRWMHARMREQHLYFPWCDGTRAARLRYPLPTAERVHAGVLDMLDAGDGYRVGYRAAFQHQPAAALAGLQVPTLMAYRAGDVLAPHAPRCPALPPPSRVAVLADEAALNAEATALFDATAAQADVVDSAQRVAPSAARTRRLVGAGGIAWSFQIAAGPDAEAPATLALSDIGQPAELPSANGLRIAVDWPGHGASLVAAGADLAMPALAAALHAALVAWLPPHEAVALQARGAGTVLARHLAQRLGTRCVSVQATEPPPASPQARAHFLQSLPTLVPDAHGGALLAAWDWARLSQLYDPWQPPTATAALDMPAPDPHRLHLRVREMLRAGPLHAALWHAALHEG